MPFYEYVCESCGKEFVLLQSMGAKAEETVCPYCSKMQAKKRLSSFSSSGSGSACSISGGHSWGGG